MGEPAQVSYRGNLTIVQMVNAVRETHFLGEVKRTLVPGAYKMRITMIGDDDEPVSRDFLCVTGEMEQLVLADIAARGGRWEPML
jgi:hypothetical protein